MEYTHWGFSIGLAFLVLLAVFIGCGKTIASHELFGAAFFESSWIFDHHINDISIQLAPLTRV